jgi:chemotaxis protein CheZ
MKNQEDLANIQKEILSGDCVDLSKLPNEVLIKIMEHLIIEMKELQDFILEAREEIQAVRGDVASGTLSISVQDELDAVITTSASATNAILDAVENMGSTIEILPKSYQGALQDQITLIFEACTFQDIIGQRVQKVLRALGGVESKVEKILSSFSNNLSKADKTFVQTAENEEAGEKLDEKSLMNGPQLAQPTQDIIDDLFSKS